MRNKIKVIDLVSIYHGMQQNSLVLAATIDKYYFFTFVWDTNDLCEETLSGSGTTRYQWHWNATRGESIRMSYTIRKNAYEI